MSKFKVGDKVYLEGKISEYDESDNTYYVEYCNYYKNTRMTYWVKDDVLHSADESYDKGLNDGWELAKRITLMKADGGYSCEELENIFGYRNPEFIFKAFTSRVALAKVKAYEEERNEIKVGDVVRLKDGYIEGIVTRINETCIYRLFKDGSSNRTSVEEAKENLVKIGHFDSIDEFMRSEE